MNLFLPTENRRNRHPAPAEHLTDGNTYTAGESRTLTGARVTKRNAGGEAPINSGGLTDRLLLTPVGAGPEEKISLPEKLLVEKITVYGEKGFYVYPEVKSGENWINLTPIAEE
ncbi:MAG TPA: hypothetical protein DEB05_04640, partial [Firmicutes bacterium]|nr:hypothetical protein [Bacillota bacterium]